MTDFVNNYVYDYLYKNNFKQSAKIFLSELQQRPSSSSSNKRLKVEEQQSLNLPKPNVQIDLPNSFLLDWFLAYFELQSNPHLLSPNFNEISSNLQQRYDLSQRRQLNKQPLQQRYKLVYNHSPQPRQPINQPNPPSQQPHPHQQLHQQSQPLPQPKQSPISNPSPNSINRPPSRPQSALAHAQIQQAQQQALVASQLQSPQQINIQQHQLLLLQRQHERTLAEAQLQNQNQFQHSNQFQNPYAQALAAHNPIQQVDHQFLQYQQRLALQQRANSNVPINLPPTPNQHPQLQRPSTTPSPAHNLQQIPTPPPHHIRPGSNGNFTDMPPPPPPNHQYPIINQSPKNQINGYSPKEFDNISPAHRSPPRKVGRKPKNKRPNNDDDSFNNDEGQQADDDPSPALTPSEVLASIDQQPQQQQPPPQQSQQSQSQQSQQLQPLQQAQPDSNNFNSDESQQHQQQQPQQNQQPQSNDNQQSSVLGMDVSTTENASEFLDLNMLESIGQMDDNAAFQLNEMFNENAFS